VRYLVSDKMHVNNHLLHSCHAKCCSEATPSVHPTCSLSLSLPSLSLSLSSPLSPSLSLCLSSLSLSLSRSLSHTLPHMPSLFPPLSLPLPIHPSLPRPRPSVGIYLQAWGSRAAMGCVSGYALWHLFMTSSVARPRPKPIVGSVVAAEGTIWSRPVGSRTL
jgi:hypothetical protein